VRVIDADSEAAVADAISGGIPLEIIGSGSKLCLGRPVSADLQLSLAGLTGITLFEPNELVMSVRAATRLADIEALLATEGQTLAFEPPDLSRLLGVAAGGQTLGGIVASNLSGPRRAVAGGVRDHVLGMRAVNGRGEIFRAGGRVVKNVTGFDLCKLLTGSYGTLAVFTEVTIKLLPAAETEVTLALADLGPQAAVTVMCRAMGSSAGISGAAWLPDQRGGSLTALRLEGFAPSVEARKQRLLGILGGTREAQLWSETASRVWWRDLRDVAPLAGDSERAIWKISLAATQAPALLESLKTLGDARALLDWGGALMWLSLPCQSDAQASSLRRLLPAGAHAMLVKAPAAVRAGVPVFHPLPPAQAMLEERVRHSFDPHLVLNPGRRAAAPPGEGEC
jgi:glycolate oxidase FAD binding subunit